MALSRIQSVCLLLSMRYLWERCWLVACFLHFIECNMQMRQPFKSRSLKQQLQIVASVQWTNKTIGAHIPNKNTQFFVFMLVWSLFSFFSLLYSVGSTLEVLLPVQVHAWIESKRPTETKTHLGKRERFSFRSIEFLQLCVCVIFRFCADRKWKGDMVTMHSNEISLATVTVVVRKIRLQF